MCGIVGFSGNQQAAPVLLDGLRKMEYRGYDSAGVAVIDRQRIELAKVKGRIDNLSELTKEGSLIHGVCGIGHTRWATHGAPNDINAHPHLSNDGRFAVVHNGIIENFAELREELISKGFEFKSQTDTEVVVNLIELYYTGDLKIAIMKTVNRLEGSYGLGIISKDEPGTIFAVKQSSPLIIGLGAGETIFASDVTAIVPYTKSVIYLDDGEIAEVRKDGVKIFDASGREIQKPVKRINWNVAAAEKGGYEHFMLKEIMEQPAALRATIEPRIKDDRIKLDDFYLSAGDLKNINKIVITACGSAYYAGCVGKYAIEQLCRIPVDVQLASELQYSDPMIDEHTLLIVLSQSGETADTRSAMEECKRRGARTLAIVNVVESSVAKLADDVIYTWAGPEIAVATTKGFTTQVAVLYMFALYAASLLGRVDDARYSELLTEIRNFPKMIQEALDMNTGISRLAPIFAKQNSVFFIGRQSDWAIALEGALKLKEISYVHAEAYAAGEIKHGTIALIDEGQPVVAICANDRLRDKTKSNMMEAKARGAHVIALAKADDRAMVAEADDCIFIPVTENIFSALLAIIPLQLLAYYVAKERGCDIDKPRNLAKSVTVE